ncbi:MAG: D-cysteine desulfhydrase family protein [Chloroflexi bacterium]|nr:D-cysteine desulfhydrase family protein [Chloroflexota bacterium]
MPITTHLPRYPLAFLPTPLHPLPRLSELLASSFQPPASNFQLLVKRDDQTGLATGGNKTRKLEFLVADALAQGCDTLITTGAVQSNHCRQTAAAAARAGLACELVLGGQPPAQPNGNYLLDMLCGAKFHWTTRENRLNRLHELANELRAAGRRPYFITYGGSDPVGACGYAAALEELREQTAALGVVPDAIVFPSSSGGTQAGLVAGAWALGWNVPILGISIDESEAELQTMVAELASLTVARLGKPHTFAPADIQVSADYLGAGYSVVGDLEREAIGLLARTEGVLLDPVYTGRAFGGLLDILRHRPNRFGKPVRSIIFWHTGGSPALFAYAGELV